MASMRNKKNYPSIIIKILLLSRALVLSGSALLLRYLEFLGYFAAYVLEYCGDPKYLDRSISTLT